MWDAAALRLQNGSDPPIHAADPFENECFYEPSTDSAVARLVLILTTSMPPL